MRIRTALLIAAGVLIPAALLTFRLSASDHADTAANYNRIGADMTDVFIFPSATNANNVVVAMDVHGLIPAGQTASFDTGVLYEMKFDLNQDYVEDKVIQFRFVGTGANQQVLVSGPATPAMTGTTSAFGRPYATTGTVNTTFSPTANMQVFAGVRSEPFFFDLNRFFALFPDRATPLTGMQVDNPNGIPGADTPQIPADNPMGTVSFRGFSPNTVPGADTTPAQDFLANLNVLSIVVEMPRSMLGSGVVYLWETTSVPMNGSSYLYSRQDRLARPAVNEALATVTANRHAVNNMANPSNDPNANQLASDISFFMTNIAGRSSAITSTLVSILAPDVMKANLASTGPASYLGYEVNAANFGGRKLTDDVVDVDLQAIFGNLLPSLGVPDDGHESPTLVTDHVGPHTDYLTVFPYLGNPH